MSRPASTQRRPTQEERRTATRARVRRAAAAALVEDGFSDLTTRSVAHRAGVSQGTVMHYFASREALLGGAAEQVALDILDEVSTLANAAPPEGADDRGATMLDLLWERFRGPQGLAIGQLWTAAWANPELTEIVATFDRQMNAALLATTGRLYPEHAEDPAVEELVESAMAMMRGLAILSPITGTANIDARWATIRPTLIRSARDTLRPTT